MMHNKDRFIIATVGHGSIYDNEAWMLHKHGLLRFVARGTRRGVAGIPLERTRLKPIIGLSAYAATHCLSAYQAESFWFGLSRWLDHWVKDQLRPGDHVISTYGVALETFKRARRQGGKTFLDAGNSHPDYFWSVLQEEHRRWGCRQPPIAPHHYERSLAMLSHVDYVLSASTFVTNSFLERGFKPDQILPHPRIVDLSSFKPSTLQRHKDRPLTLISTGALCLRKGTPYLLEAYRLIRRKIPDARLILRRIIRDDVKDVIRQFSDLPIEWLESMPHHQLAEHLRNADVFLLPSLEDGLALTVVEALACGLPVIITPNTGASDLMMAGINGEIVPIRDATAIANAVEKWWEKILSVEKLNISFNTRLLSPEHFEATFLGQLRALQLA